MIKERDEVDEIVDDDLADDVVDDKVKKGSEDGASEEDTPLKDIRSAIKNAFKEHADKEDVEDKPEPKEKKAKVKSEYNLEDKEEIEDKPSDKKPEEKLETPPFYRTKGKALWDGLSSEQRKLIVAREKEVSDGFKQNSEKVRAFDEMEQVLAPRRQAIQQYGVTPAQTVDRLFQWMEALSHQDLNYRVNALNALAQSFGVPIARLNPQTKNAQVDGNDADPVEQNTNQPPEWFQQFASRVSNEIGGIKQQTQSQQEAAANTYLNNWANGKTHFQGVRQMMFQLIASGIVPPKNGEVDLDGAYEKAIALNPEISAQVQQEAAEKAAQEAKAKANQDAKAKAARLLKAKNAGSGIRPAAPSLSAERSNSKPNGSGGKPLSVRDSIRNAMEELRD